MFANPVCGQFATSCAGRAKRRINWVITRKGKWKTLPVYTRQKLLLEQLGALSVRSENVVWHRRCVRAVYGGRRRRWMLIMRIWLTSLVRRPIERGDDPLAMQIVNRQPDSHQHKGSLLEEPGDLINFNKINKIKQTLFISNTHTAYTVNGSSEDDSFLYSFTRNVDRNGAELMICTVNNETQHIYTFMA